MRLRVFIVFAVSAIVLGVLSAVFKRDKLYELRPFVFSERHRYLYNGLRQPTEERLLKLRGLDTEKVVEIVKRNYPAEQGWQWYEQFPTADRTDNTTESIGVHRQAKGEVEVQEYHLLKWTEVAWLRVTHLGKNPFENP